MHEKVLREIRKRPDLIYVDHLQMSQFVPNPRPCPVLLDEHNVEWRIIQRYSATESSLPFRLFAALEWRRLRDYELSACEAADLVFTVTRDDKDTLVAHGIPPEKIVSLPVGVDTNYFTPVRSRPGDRKILTFGTMSWPPNADSVAWFVKAVYPLVKRQIADVHFAAVGANPPPRLSALSRRDPTIDIPGFVEDIRTAAPGTAAFVVPLRIGSGMRVKIVDAMAMALPVVTTSVGCEGIALQPGTHALVADDPREFAEHVVSLLLHYPKRQRLGLAGRELVERSYSWPSILQRLDEALTNIQS